MSTMSSDSSSGSLAPAPTSSEPAASTTLAATHSGFAVLLQIADRIRAKLNGSITHISGISFAEYQLLDAIRHRQTRARADTTLGATRVQLADAVGLTPSGISRALKPLEKIGLVESVKAARDARQTLAHLTPAGQECLGNCDSLLAETLDALPTIPVEDQVLDDYLAQLMRPVPRVMKHHTNGAFLSKR